MMRIGLLVGGLELDRWAARSVRRALQKEDVELSLIIVDDRTTELNDYFSFIQEEGVWAIQQLSQRLVNQIHPPLYRESVPIDTVINDEVPETVHCEPISSPGLGVKLPPDVVRAIEMKTDVVVRFGFGIIQGDVLTAPRYGVLSFHHGDFRKYRGRPPGFWEYMNRDTTAKVTLQQLSERLDAGTIVSEREVDISTSQTWQDIKQRLFEASEPMLASGISALREDSLRTVPESELGDIYTRPDWRTYARYLWLNTKGRVKTALR